MRVTFLPHALMQMRARGISEGEARVVVGQPDEEGVANFGRLYAQKVIGHRRIRVVYNQGADEIVVVSVMLRRREGGRS
jgi:Domain of unknown function (DUF4258)